MNKHGITVEYRIHRFSTGATAERVVVDAPYELVGSWLESDVQTAESAKNFYLPLIDGILAGTVVSHAGSGNAYATRIEKEATQLKGLYDSGVLELPTALLREALVQHAQHRRASGKR